MGWKPDHRPIREKYNPKPNAAEARHEDRLRGLPCIGCGREGNIECHHTMMEFPNKRWRRDHHYQLPVCPDCHRGPKGIHGIGSEAKWAAARGVDTATIAQMEWEISEELERRAA
jgi:hypothetical protein